ncbi:MAG: glycosyltransferase [Nitrososphaerota archaeon]
MLKRKGLIVNIAKERTGVGNYVKLIMEYGNFDYDILNISLFWKGKEADYPRAKSGKSYFFSPNSKSMFVNLLSIFFGNYSKKVGSFISKINQNYDFIFLSSPDLIFLAPVFYDKYSTRIVVTVHDKGIFKLPMHPYAIFLKYNFRRLKNVEISCIIYDSQQTENDLEAMYDDIHKKGRVVELTVDTSKFMVRDQAKCRSLLGLPIDVPIVLNVGNDGYVKNVETVFRSLPEIENNFLFVRVGRLRRTKKIYDSLNPEIRKKIIVIDDVTDETLPLYSNAADVFVFPSLKEGFGLELVEAVLSGNEVVTTDAPPMNKIIGELGYYVHNPRDFHELARVISDALTNKAKNKIKNNPSEEWVRRFSVNRFISETEDCFFPEKLHLH